MKEISSKPHLIIISGPPAAGKSTSAQPLATAMGYPLLCMDDIKERLADAIGPGASAIADAIGDAAFRQLIASARELLTYGISVVAEGFFQSDRYSTDFAALVSLAEAVHVHFRAADDVLKERYEQRALQNARHWIHGDLEKLGTLKPELPAYMAEPLLLDIPRIVIDTTAAPTNIPSLAQLILQTAQHQLPEWSA